MAKRRPTILLDRMEEILGYKVASLNDAYGDKQRFYSDLTAVPLSVYERTRNELDEYSRTKRYKNFATALESLFPGPGVSHKITSSRNTVVLERRNCAGQYGFTADIESEFGFHLPLQLTKNEALAAMSVAKLRHGNVSDSASQFFRLPREVREEIYAYAIPETETQIVGSGDASGVDFARGMGDPSGFYFPFRSNLGILAVNRQMRKEALQLVYRKTSIHLNDMDEFIKFAISIGKTGRLNVESELRLGKQK